MLCVEDEEDLKSSDEFRVGFEVIFVELVQHVEEVFNEACIFMGLIVFTTDTMTVGVGCDGGHSSEKSVDLFITNLFILVDSLSNE